MTSILYYSVLILFTMRRRRTRVARRRTARTRKFTAGLIVGLLALAIAVIGMNDYLSASTTGAAVFAGAGGSLVIAAVSLVIALALFANYFGLMRK